MSWLLAGFGGQFGSFRFFFLVLWLMVIFVRNTLSLLISTFVLEFLKFLFWGSLLIM